jgi:hypothetical protein
MGQFNPLMQQRLQTQGHFNPLLQQQMQTQSYFPKPQEQLLNPFQQYQQQTHISSRENPLVSSINSTKNKKQKNKKYKNKKYKNKKQKNT